MDNKNNRFTEMYNTVSMVIYALNNVEVKGAVNMGNLYTSIQQLEGLLQTIRMTEDSIKNTIDKEKKDN